MDSKINGRTPEEIKKGLAHCATEGSSCKGCAFCADCDVDIYAIERYAIAYIQQLEDGIKLLRAYNKGTLQKIVQLERERDAAVEDINEAAMIGCLCYVCSRNEKGHCKAFDHGIFEATVMCGRYEWRGIQEVE